ncbi:hypothetical protein [Nocardia spumae]|nr:hypothetical protein [Nocardia spumae]
MTDRAPDVALGPFPSPDAWAAAWAAAPTVGFAVGKPPMSSRTRHTWPRR